MRIPPYRYIGAALAGAIVAAVAALSSAAAVPGAARSFEFPAAAANGVSGDLVLPAGTTSALRFDSGEVAVGELPVPLPARSDRRGRVRRGAAFVRPAGIGPHARLLLAGVVDGSGQPVTNSGNQLIIDAVVSPSTAVSGAPPFAVPFDISGGNAFIDAALAIDRQSEAPVRVQILGVAVVDPDGQPFGVLGFELPVAAPTAARPTPTPGGNPAADGQCFASPSCDGASFAASQQRCRRMMGRSHLPAAVTASWCPRDQFDPATGHCATGACVACTMPDCGTRPICGGPCVGQCEDGQVLVGECQQGEACRCALPCAPAPTPTPDPCAAAALCGGACSVTCADGTSVAGECTLTARGCACDAGCAPPPPCSPGQCFDTLTVQCTGHACGPDAPCPLPNQLCDLTGRHCPCTPSPRPQPLCCECGGSSASCFMVPPFAGAAPACPQGCTSVAGAHCDAATGTCTAAPPCRTDADCPDDNGCTADRCVQGACVHDCVCVGPAACGSGPGDRPHP